MIGPSLLVLSLLTSPAKPVPDTEAREWLRWCVPLPRHAAIQGKVVVPARSVRVEFPQPPTDLDRATAADLSRLLPGGAPTAFFIRFERPGRLPASIADAPNRDQAYAVEPVRAPDGAPLGLRCVAETDVGTRYAALTLKQLLTPRRKGRGNAATVEIPLLRVADWPDLEERGEWGGTAAADLEWMAERKMNLIEAHAALTVDAQGAGHAKMDPMLLHRARQNAVRIVPIIHHLEQIADSGIFRVYPQLKAVGAEGSICFSRAEIVDLLAQWLKDLAQTPGVFDVMVWLSEEGKGCACPECAKEDRFVKETRACLAAWERVRHTHPRLGLRLLTTQASYPSNAKVLAVLPEGVKVSYYHGSLTYDTSRRPMIYPLLEEYARAGRWLGVYPTVSANWLVVAPFTNPAFVHTRLNEFVAKRLRCLVAYAVPANAYYRANVEGAAE
ncbi:MAG: hypothetical protein QHJ73_18045, partial [Armatimonadota bacterium]|nr:hypothetical protein [Armatimonadota bacterium]